MAKHRKFDLLDAIVQAVNYSGWNVIYETSPTDHPFRLRVFSEQENYRLRIYVWNLTHGGGAARPRNEYRIQITGVSRFEQLPDEKTLILGWWQSVGVFAGFDYRKHSGLLGASPSIQIREENLRKALLNGFSACDRGNGETAIAFRPDFLIEYIRFLHNLHDVGEVPHDLTIFEDVADGTVVVNEQVMAEVTKPRQTVLETISRKLRDHRFKNRVLNAYGNRCAFSGMQLNLVDAAHIIPVSVTGSTDETSNGIALSALYHRAYDKGLITFNENYQTLVNHNALRKLKAGRLDGGLNVLLDNLRPIIVVPPSVSDRPNTGLVIEANRLRGWNP